MWRRGSKRWCAVSAVGILLLLSLFITYRAGWRFGEGFSLAAPGSVSMHEVPPETKVYVDNKRRAETAEGQRDLTFTNISAGAHLLLASREGYWPWFKELSVSPGEQTRVSMFAVPQNPSGVIIKEADPSYRQIRALIQNARVPSADAPLLSADASVAIFTDGGTAIHARWRGEEGALPSFFCDDASCTERAVVFEGASGVNALSFYPGRSDVLLFSGESGIYAIEIDRRGTQNFQPVYLGPAPTFVPKEDAALALYVDDQGSILELSLAP